MNSIVIRDGLRNEMAKQQHLEEEMKEKREQQKMDIAKLNLMINLGEEQMVKLRKRYEKNVQHRNDRQVMMTPISLSTQPSPPSVDLLLSFFLTHLSVCARAFG